MKKLILLAVAVAPIFAQTSGVITNPVASEVIGGTYASAGTATSAGSTIPAFINTTATLSTSTNIISVASATGIVIGQLAVSANLTNGAAKVTGISGTNITLATTPFIAAFSAPVQFESVYFNFDGTPGCANLCGFSLGGAPAASVTFLTVIGAGLGQWAPTTHTISLTVVDAAGNTSTTGNTSVTVYNSDPTGNCSNTLISGAIRCMGAATAGTTGPTASVTLTGTFQVGDVIHASQFLNRPASPFSTSISGVLNATQTNVTITAPPTYTGTASTSGSSTTATLDATSYGQVCVTQLGQVITGTGFPAGTTIINCLGSNQVLLSQAANATSASISIQHTFPTATGIATATVASGGTGYVLSDILLVSGGTGGHLRVTSISSGGVVTGVVPIALTPAEFFTANGYSNGSGVSTTGGSGSGATVNITAGFIATITDLGVGPGYELWCVTAMGGAGNINWTVTRGCAGTQGIAHPSGGHIGAFDPGPYSLLPSYISDNVGNTWTLITHVGTGFSDDNTVDTGVYYTTFTSGTAAAATSMGETITFTHPFAQLTNGIVSLNAKWYRGLGALGNINNAQSTMGYAGPSGTAGPFNASMALNRVIPTAAGNSWTVSSGDLCIVSAAGSPFMVVNASPPGPTTNALSYTLGGSGVVRTSVNTITWISGTTFNTSYPADLHSTAWQPGSSIILGGSTTVHIAAVVDSTHITTIESLTTSTSESYSVPDGGFPASPASGWTLRERDSSRLFDLDAIATTTSCNGGALVTNVDGMDTIGTAFHPASPATIGQSLTLTTQQASNTTNVLAPGSGQSWYANWSIHNWGTTGPSSAPMIWQDPGSVNILYANVSATGAGSFTLTYGNNFATGAGFTAFLTGLDTCSGAAGNGFLTVQFSKQFVTTTTGNATMTVWDCVGRIVNTQSSVFTADVQAGGPSNLYFGGLTGSVGLEHAYFNIYNGTPPARPPITADSLGANCVAFWKFDGGNGTGQLTDACHNYALTLPGSAPTCSGGTIIGSACYEPTPGQSLVAAIPTSALAASVPPGAQACSVGVTCIGDPPWVVGHAGQLDDTAAYSQSNAPSLTHAWSLVSGPSSLTFSSTSSATPTVTGFSDTRLLNPAQDYLVQDVVSDSYSLSSGTGQIDVGAITQANGIITTSGLAGPSGLGQSGLPSYNQFWGSQIGYGSNPFGYEDWWQYHALQLREAIYTGNYVNGGSGVTSCGWASPACNGIPQWENYGPGTISYFFNCAGAFFACSGTGTTLASTLHPGDATITLTNAGTMCTSAMMCLDLSGLPGTPTRVILYDGTNMEEDRICSFTGNVLTRCFDPTPHTQFTFAPTSTLALQGKVTGTSTKFETDTGLPSTSLPVNIGSLRAVCPVAASSNSPSLPGPSSWSAGTVAINNGSNTLTGTGTTWVSGTGASSAILAGFWVQINAAPSGSGPFVFMRQIASINSDSSITLAGPAYPGTNTSGLSYNIVTGQRTLIEEYNSGYSDPTYDTTSSALIGVPTSGCESDTAAYQNEFAPAGGVGQSYFAGRDLPAYNGKQYSGVHYSVTDSTGWVNNSSLGGISFYCESCSWFNLHISSGLAAPLVAARQMSNYWAHSPWGSAVAGYPTLYQGEVLGGIAAKVSDPASSLNWASLRQYGAAGVLKVQQINASLPSSCNTDDTRDIGYSYRFLIEMAQVDPDTTSTSAPGGISWRAYWQSWLSQMQTTDTACQSQVGTGAGLNSFANGLYFNPNLPNVTMTNGSATATGSANIASSTCAGTATGTATVTNGSSAITITGGTVPGGTNNLFLTGTTNSGSTVFVQSMAYGSGQLAGFWLGDSGTITWVSSTLTNGNPGEGDAGDMLTFATDGSDPNMQKSWACIWNSASSITLNRTWDGTTGSYHPYHQNLAGFGQQPFMLGIKTSGENDLATATLSALSGFVSPYQTFRGNSTTWVWTYGLQTAIVPGTSTQMLATNYGRVFQQCEPTNGPSSTIAYGWLTPGCTYSGDPVTVSLAREQNAEAGAAYALYFQSNSSPANCSQLNKIYGALWGSTGFNSRFAYQDAFSTSNNPSNSNLADSGIIGGKWTGFFTGIGNARHTPAVLQSCMSGNSYNPVPVFGRGIMGK